MKKTAFLIGFVLSVFVIDLNARTLHVGENGTYSTIAAALDEARPGDTILVEKGIYREGNLIIQKPVFLMGKDYPVLDGEGRSEILTIVADGTVLEGFEVRNSGSSSYLDIAAIRLKNVRNVSILNNRLVNNFFGIFCQHGSRCTIRGNQVSSNATTELNSANGIHCWKSDSLLIQDNDVSGHRDGIYFEFVNYSLIRGNNSHGNVRYGLHFMFSNEDLYMNNTFGENGAGVAVMYSKKVTMLRNLFTENWGAASYGILLKEISDAFIEGNRFLKNTIGIYMESSNRIYITQNEFHNNGWALRVQASCDGSTITRNNFTGNTFEVATNGSLVLNSFNGNYWDKYEGYDLNRDGVGDVPYRPVSMYAMIVERNPSTMMLFRSFLVTLLDKTEKAIPDLTPEALKDDYPSMRPLKW